MSFVRAAELANEIVRGRQYRTDHHPKLCVAQIIRNKGKGLPSRQANSSVIVVYCSTT